MQILNRISRFIKSNISDVPVNSRTIFNDEDDELKRIIDELNSSQTKNSKTESEENKYYTENPVNDELSNAYNLLGLSHNSDIETIKKTYKKKMKEFHPDKVSHLDDEIRKKAELRTKQINEAYNRIKKARNF